MAINNAMDANKPEKRRHQHRMASVHITKVARMTRVDLKIDPVINHKVDPKADLRINPGADPKINPRVGNRIGLATTHNLHVNI